MNLNTKKIAYVISALFAGIAASNVSAQVSDDVIRIGLLTDLSGPYLDIDGPGGVEAIRMAIADFGGKVNGKKIEFVYADHQNKTEIAATKSREWIDRNGVDLLLGGGASAANLAMAKVASEKAKPFIVNGAGTTRLTNEECTPYTIHYAYDTKALANVSGSAVVKQGGKSWFFLTLDSAFGTSTEKDTSDVIKASGGTVVGSVRHPASASDFSSFLLQAQASKAQILGLANAGTDTVNAIKGANEFGLTKNMKLAGSLLFIMDIHSLGLNLTKGMYLTDNWYWDQSPESRTWSKRFFNTIKKMPSSVQAAQYSAVTHYLNAVKGTGTDDTEKVLTHMRSNKINDMYAKDGYIRPDGRMVHEMYLMEVKSPSESKYPWDYYKIVQKVSGEQAFTKKEESKCALWK
ncbi:ABC transporter substrate-binding protein [Noviherbaspirillum sp. Root189]|uniref:ABC transporter substrate-binding protein n=1 Tax=Noviherbaspirillum sp. Root189 TaxID=1736487 RepID=UPI00070A5CCD|nr:ABC transporter substrate-binding protein [Noviherbaspirillum sp. Root189]KRB83496.1 ABC transporter permease [Noviherbaspirillum sp. Root189]